jgi:hypothetical protein
MTKRRSTRHTRGLACSIIVALWLCAASLGCDKGESAAKPEAQQTAGGDSALDRAGHNIALSRSLGRRAIAAIGGRSRARGPRG